MSDARTTTLATRLTGQAAATALAASAGAVLIVAGIIRAAVSQALFADGSNYLLQIVNTHGFFLVDGRTLGTRLLQAPAVVAVSWFNVHSYHVLSIALGLGYFVEPAVLCALALVIARRDRTVLVFAVTASTLLITLSSGLAMECTLATALFIVAATMLLVDDALSWPRIVVLALIALLAMSTYQSFVVLAPALVLLLVARHARPVPHVPVWVTIGLSLLLTAATVTSGISLSHPDPSGGRLLTCATRISCYSSTSQAHLVIATLIIAGLAVGAWFAEPLVTPSGRSGWLIAAVVVVFLLLVTTRVPIEPAVSYDIRGAVAGLAVVLALVVGATKLWAGRSSRPTTLPLPLALRAGVVAVSLVSLAGSVPVAVGWSDYVASFQAGVRAHTGSISVLALRVPSTLSGTYGWPWTNPFVGIEVADGSGRTGVRNIGNVTVAINTFGDQVFSYAQAPSLATLPPSLHHYGW